MGKVCSAWYDTPQEEETGEMDVSSVLPSLSVSGRFILHQSSPPPDHLSPFCRYRREPRLRVDSVSLLRRVPSIWWRQGMDSRCITCSKCFSV